MSAAVLETAERPPPLQAPAVAATPGRLLAVDIGRTGALALFAGNELVEIADIPVLADGPTGRPTINAPLLAALIRRLSPDEAVVEHVSARPGEDRRAHSHSAGRAA